MTWSKRGPACKQGDLRRRNFAKQVLIENKLYMICLATLAKQMPLLLGTVRKTTRVSHQASRLRS